VQGLPNWQCPKCSVPATWGSRTSCRVCNEVAPVPVWERLRQYQLQFNAAKGGVQFVSRGAAPNAKGGSGGQFVSRGAAPHQKSGSDKGQGKGKHFGKGPSAWDNGPPPACGDGTKGLQQQVPLTSLLLPLMAVNWTNCLKLSPFLPKLWGLSILWLRSYRRLFNRSERRLRRRHRLRSWPLRENARKPRLMQPARWIRLKGPWTRLRSS
jgi:hypothetical protein